MISVSARYCRSLAAGLVFGATALSGQSDSLRLSVANLTEDVRLLSQQVKTLRLEIEDMRRENERLRRQLSTAANDQSSYQQTLAAVDARLAALRAEFQQADDAQRARIVAEVTRQIEELAGATQKQIDAVAKAVGTTPDIAPPVRFSDEYPRTGIKYQVRSGDTLSKIAREYGSTVKHIQNANRITDPARDLQVGQTIFIPVEQ